MEFSYLCNSVKKYINDNKGKYIAIIFKTTLTRYMKQKKMPNNKLYKKARVDRRLYWKCVTKNEYLPTKNTMASLGLALELNMQEMTTLFEIAGFSLNSPSIFNLVIKYCVEHGVFNVEIVDLLLDEAGEKPLHKE